MNFNISTVPFSRYGSYLAIGRRLSSGEQPGAVVLRSVHGDVQNREVMMIELLADGKPLLSKDTASPGALRLDTKHGWTRFCFADPKCLRIQARNVTVRLTMSDPGVMGFAMPLDEKRWQINSFPHRSSFGLTPIRGQLEVDAPWEKTCSKHIVAELSPKGGATSELAIGTKLGIDATHKLAGEGFKRSWPPLIRMNDAVRKKVDAILGPERLTR